MHTTHELVFLGTGAACGNPIFYCGCPVCEEARACAREAKTCSAIAVLGSQTTLIDAGPELRLQLTREEIHRVDRILFTHEHFDHTGGLAQMEFAVRLSNKERKLPVYGSARALSWLESHFDWMWDTINPVAVEPFQTLVFDEVSYTALPATHCPDALGYLIQSKDFCVAYFPDTGPLTTKTKDCLTGIDALIHDSTFIGRNWHPHTHSTVVEAIQLGQELGVGTVYLTHCSMHFDEARTAASLQAELEQMNIGPMRIVLAYDGMRIKMDGSNTSYPNGLPLSQEG